MYLYNTIFYRSLNSCRYYNITNFYKIDLCIFYSFIFMYISSSLMNGNNNSVPEQSLRKLIAYFDKHNFIRISVFHPLV